MIQRSWLKIATRYKNFWLIPIVLIFFISAMISLVQLKQSIAILDDRYGTSVWSLFQLKTEMRRFYDALSVYKHSPEAYAEVTERYDLLWSRYPILLQGEDAAQLEKIPGARAFISHSFDELQALEDVVFDDLAVNPVVVDAIQEILKPHISGIDKITLDNYHFNNDFYNRGDRRVEALQKQLIWLMFGLIASGCLLLLIIIRENRINRYQAEHDSLTSMPNRAYLRKRLTLMCNRKASFALHLIDLNGFKDVNDTLGHHTGDILLQKVSQRLMQEIDQHFGCTTCRLGGDEFAVLHYSYQSEQDIQAVADQILSSLEAEFYVDNHSCFIGASVGSVIYPDHGDNASNLLTHADIAMYKAKESAPTSKQVLFDFEMDAIINRRQQINRDLREALEHNKLSLAYQPIIDLRTKKIHYFEALLRWKHSIYGQLSPLEVINVAEQYGLAHQLGSWVIDQSCRQLKLWKQLGLDHYPISVNISPSMYRFDLSNTINSSLQTHGLKKGQIWIEVTEDTTMQSIKEANDMLENLLNNEVSIALDDFGTGLSSLSHLQQMHVQTLKIDRSFIHDIVSNPTSSALVKNIIAIGHDLGMKVVAEGIECERAEKILADYNCDFGQGYLISKPLPAQQATELISHSSEPA